MTELNPQWCFPPADLNLPDRTVHVWCASLDHPPEHWRRLANVCDRQEHARAARFHFNGDRRRFLAGRGLRRLILSAYLEEEPHALVFAKGRYGKPVLASSELQFNVSHSHQLFVCAIAHNLNLGIDIEHVRPLPDAEQIAARFFSAREYASWGALPPSLQLESFFACWTRKEAFIKAIEEGLSRPLDSFDVSVGSHELAQLLHVADTPAAINRFSLYDLPAIKGYKAALALEAQDYTIECWRWTTKSSIGLC